MIVTLTQTDLREGYRSRNLGMIQDAIRLAAENNPSPDLIVLPDCGGLAVSTFGGRTLTPAMSQGLTESFAWQAREWGVWLAVGHDRAVGDDVIRATTLFDPDGDAYARFPSSVVAAGEQPAAEPTDETWSVRATPLGVIALSLGRRGISSARLPRWHGRQVDLAIVSAAVDEAWEAKECVALAKANGCYVCMARLVRAPRDKHSRRGGPSLIVDPDGRIMAEVPDKSPAIAVAELKITPPPAALMAGSGLLEDVERGE